MYQHRGEWMLPAHSLREVPFDLANLVHSASPASAHATAAFGALFCISLDLLMSEVSRATCISQKRFMRGQSS